MRGKKAGYMSLFGQDLRTRSQNDQFIAECHSASVPARKKLVNKEKFTFDETDEGTKGTKTAGLRHS